MSDDESMDEVESSADEVEEREISADTDDEEGDGEVAEVEGQNEDDSEDDDDSDNDDNNSTNNGGSNKNDDSSDDDDDNDEQDHDVVQKHSSGGDSDKNDDDDDDDDDDDEDNKDNSDRLNDNDNDSNDSDDDEDDVPPKKKKPLSSPKDDDDDDDEEEEEEDDEVMAAVVVDEEVEDDGDDTSVEEVIEAEAVEVVPEEDDDDDEDDEDEDDDDDEEEEPVKAKKKGKSKPKQKPQKKTSSSSSTKKKSSSSKKKKSGTSKKKTVKKKKIVTKKKKKTSKRKEEQQFAKISAERMHVAQDCRLMLQEAVPSLPIAIAETQVRSFGRLVVEPASEKTKFSSANALYPIGFSCDRYEFSPVHGRILKMRCSILDGRKLKQKKKKKESSSHPNKIDGPVFRIMWGPGVDEDVDNVDYPYDPYANSPPISSDGKVDAVAVPASESGRKDTSASIKPEEGMRVKVRFDQDELYQGTIIKVSKNDEKKKKRKRVQITIRYDDGSTESALFPDADISLIMPDSYRDVDDQGNIDLTELKGRPVTTVIGSSPLDAWGKVLIRLGLTDEIMVETALEAVKDSREDGLKDAKSKLEAQKLQRQQARARMMRPSPDKDDESKSDEELIEEKKNEGGGMDVDSESITSKERELREKVENLRKELEEAKTGSQDAAVDLADARISLLGPFLCNPFRVIEGQPSQQDSWLVTAVRKEKTKMGSTGNKKKIVTATDLLERNDTFYNGDIETLLEGLPGSEYCASYVYQAFRSGGASAINRAWVHEAQLRHEKEREKRMKQSKEAKVKASQEKEKELKRKQRDEARDERKRQKLEEEDQKKKARIEERLGRLSVQVDERLFKEACFQREKAIVILAKGLSKEFARRRKAAELVSSQALLDAKYSSGSSTAKVYPLPPLSQVYQEDVLRVWDFVSTFGSFFLDRGYIRTLPTLESLQKAVDSLADLDSGMSKIEAVSSMTDLAVALCKPLAASQTRLLFASLIALNPGLQKDFGAAFFNSVNGTVTKDKEKDKEDEEETAHPDVLLPVDAMTWQEIARVAFLSDALDELGYSRQESAHLLRGYRSAGHPNSKEARRLRRVEDFSIALIRQTITESRANDERLPLNKISIEVPCTPSCYPSDWIFYLHNMKSLRDSDTAGLTRNLKKAIELLKNVSTKDEESSKYIGTLEESFALLDVIDHDASVGKLAKQTAVELLEKVTGEKINPEKGKQNTREISESQVDKFNLKKESKNPKKPLRQRMGLLNSLVLTDKEYKKLVHSREEYMSDALRLKEDMERQRRKEQGVDDDDDDQDDDDDDDDDRQSGLNEKVSDEAQPEAVAIVEKDDEKEKKANEKDGSAMDCAMEIVNGEKSEEKNTLVTENGSSNKSEQEVTGPKKIGKKTQYDDFCGDIPTAPELIRRCLAVLRTVCATGPAEPFIYPVDPQTNPGYYDMVLRPMCFWKVGRLLQDAAKRFSTGELSSDEVEEAVVQFGRNIRLIAQNTLSYANAGPTVISAGGEFLRIFERLLLDWVLAPEQLLPPLHSLDDDKCVEFHVSDEESTVLLCDGCEGKYNVSRLDPPLLDIPKGDWYCPRCVTGRCWGDLDPRIGKVVTRVEQRSCTSNISASCVGRIERCFFRYSEDPDDKPSLMYGLMFEDGVEEMWSLEQVDRALIDAGVAISKVRCVQAVAESPGYSFGIDNGLRQDLVPVPLNPNISDAAAQISLSSAVFRDTIKAAGTLLVIDPQEMTASEWIRLLVLLSMKCSSSDVMQNLASKMENDAAEKMQERVDSIGKITDILEVLPDVFDIDDDDDIINEEVTSGGRSAFGQSKSSKEPSAEPVSDKVNSAAVVIDASAVEVVDSTEPDVSQSNGELKESGLEVLDETKTKRLDALTEKGNRLKAREDSIAAFCIKNQLRSTAASFEEDSVSQVVESALATDTPGLSLAATRCRRTVCDFCGLMDIALGTPLVRVPNHEEWNDIIPYASRSRRTLLVAELPKEENNGSKEISAAQAAFKKKYVSLKVRVGDELIADCKDEEVFSHTDDGGMLEFVPRNEEGFQHELKFRNESGLPYITGSLSAHDCCAVAAHNARKIQVVQNYKDRQLELAETEAGTTCGRTLRLGKDDKGRLYWKFNADPDSLFVFERDSLDVGTWHRYSDPETIASVIVSLGKDDVVRDLKRAFPQADLMRKNGTWSNALLKRHFPMVGKRKRQIPPTKDLDTSDLDSTSGDGKDMEEDENFEEPFEEGEQVLVESSSGKLLWDAKILDVAGTKAKGNISAYRVRYKGWSSRFDEWVKPNRIVEPSDNNRQAQEEMLEENMVTAREGLPPTLMQMTARGFLYAKDRARGAVPLADFARIVQISREASPNERTFAEMKAALLLIEAALPVGAVDTSKNGLWKVENACQWRKTVERANGPAILMRCVIVLEDTITEEWIKPDVGHLRSCLPNRWKALAESSAASLAIRIVLLDRALMYGTVDRKRFGGRGRK